MGTRLWAVSQVIEILSELDFVAPVHHRRNADASIQATNLAVFFTGMSVVEHCSYLNLEGAKEATDSVLGPLLSTWLTAAPGIKMGGQKRTLRLGSNLPTCAFATLGTHGL